MAFLSSVAEVKTASSNSELATRFTYRSTNGQIINRTSGSSKTAISDYFAFYSVATASPDETYKVTSVNERQQESLASTEKLVEDNVLTVAGASNFITWPSVAGAESYNIYKKLNGTFGLLGQVDREEGVVSYQFEDDGAGPDMSQTLLLPDAQVDIPGEFLA